MNEREMKYNAKHWLIMFIVEWVLVVFGVFSPFLIGDFIEFETVFYIIGFAQLFCLVPIIYCGRSYKGNNISRKQYAVHSLLSLIPGVLVPVLMIFSVWVYYAITSDNDPGGVLWVFMVIPSTVLYAVIAWIMVFVYGVGKKKKAVEE